MTEKKEHKKERPVISMRGEEKEDLWDDLLQKEEGIILGFDPETTSGKVKSLTTGEIYSIDPREQVRTRIELKNGDRVLFAPFEDPEGKDFARIIRIVELNT